MTRFGFCSRWTGFLAKKDGMVFTLYRGRCKQWSCPECSQYLRSKWRAHLAQRIQELDCERWSFFTITAPSYNLMPYAEQMRLSSALFKAKMDTVMKSLKRKFGKFEYVRVLEIQRRGAIHAHILASFHWQDVRVKEYGENVGQQYSKTLENIVVPLGFGFMCHAENLLYAPTKVAGYVTKYISKASREQEAWLPKGTRYIVTSRGIGALNRHKKGEGEYIVLSNYVRIELSAGFQLWDGDKKHIIGYEDLDESGNYY